MWRFGTNYSYMWRICTNFSYVIVWRIGTNSSHMRIIGTISSDVRRMLSIHHISEEYFTHGRNQCRYIAHVKISLVVCIYQLWFSCEWLESNAFLGRVGREGDQGINVRNYMTCKFSLARKKKKGMKSVTYWYQFFTHCEVWESVLHGVKLFGLIKPAPSDNVIAKVQASLCISTILSEPSNSGNTNGKNFFVPRQPAS